VSNQGLRWFPGRRVSGRLHPAVVSPATRDGAWLRATFALEDGRLRVARLEAVPLWTRNNFLDVARGRAERLDVRIRPLARAEEAIRDARRATIAEALGDAVRLVAPRGAEAAAERGAPRADAGASTR
jgi:hypothetical protein